MEKDQQDRPVVWEPDELDLSDSLMSAFARDAGARTGISFGSYRELWEWSTSDLVEFWRSVADFFAISLEEPGAMVVQGPTDDAQWFVGAVTSYPEMALRGRASAPAVIVAGERSRLIRTKADLRHDVLSAAAGLAALGVGLGDHVAGYLPASYEAVVAFLATAAVGACWSVCSPDLGVAGVLDRFRQISPKILIAQSRYEYGGKQFDRSVQVAEISRQLDSIETVVQVGAGPSIGSTVPWQKLLARPPLAAPVRVPFDTPLWVVYSSGTTGAPKPIVHSHGGILLEHVKLLGLHLDLRPGDRLSWYTTTGWIMWNIVTSALLVGATSVFIDGNPGWPDLDRVWTLAEDLRITHLGGSPAFYEACRKAGLQPGAGHDLARMRVIGSTGSPLEPTTAQWLHEAVSPSAHIASMSGGTDIASALVGPNPWTPARAGELQGPCLGVAAAAYSSRGLPVVGEVGELIVTKPMPSMPRYLVGDPSRVRFRASYFASFDGVWCHGDWARFAADLSVAILGRSDATLNRGGIRMGTSEFYRVLEEDPEVAESVVVNAHADGDDQLILLVQASEGATGDTGLRQRLRKLVRDQLSPRHVPDRVVFVPAIPHTLTGKKLEVPLKRILSGADISDTVDLSAVDKPELLPLIRDLVAADSSYDSERAPLTNDHP